MADRLLPPSAIPTDLWKDTAILKLAPNLSESYRVVLQKTGLLETALTATAKGDIGGESAKSTAEHFTRNFSGSCGRVQLALLDPHEKLTEASNLFIRTFTGGKVALLDIPSGSGAGSVTILSAIAHLRKASIIPREPLDVWLVAGDISQSALDNAERLLSALRPELEQQAIFVQSRFVVWDMLSSTSTIELIHTWTREHAPQDCREYFVIVANCSGFLQHEGNLKKAEPQLEQIMAWSGALKSTFVWVEPSTDAATKKMIPNLGTRLWKKVLGFFKHPEGTPLPPTEQSAVDMEHPLKAETTHRVNLTLLKLVRHEP